LSKYTSVLPEKSEKIIAVDEKAGGTMFGATQQTRHAKLLHATSIRGPRNEGGHKNRFFYRKVCLHARDVGALEVGAQDGKRGASHQRPKARRDEIDDTVTWNSGPPLQKQKEGQKHGEPRTPRVSGTCTSERGNKQTSKQNEKQANFFFCFPLAKRASLDAIKQQRGLIGGKV
jgi:hypothetical protein